MLGMLRETEILRSVAADEAAESIGLTSNPSLRALADAVDEPWQSILLDHRKAFQQISGEITALAEVNRELHHRRPALGPRDPAQPGRRAAWLPSRRRRRRRRRHRATTGRSEPVTR